MGSSLKPEPVQRKANPFDDIVAQERALSNPFAGIVEEERRLTVPVLSPLARHRTEEAKRRAEQDAASPMARLGLTPAEPASMSPAPRAGDRFRAVADATRTRPEVNPQAERLGTVARGLTMPLEMGAHLLENPVGGAAELVMAPVHAATTAGGYLGQKAAEVTLPEHERALAEADPERIKGKDAAIAGGQLAVTLAAPAISKLAGGVAAPVLGEAAGEAAGHLAAGSVAGAAWTPDDPVAGAIGGALMAGAPAARAMGRAGDVSAGVMEGAVRDLAADPAYQAEINPAAGITRSKPFVPGSAEDVALRRAAALEEAARAQTFAATAPAETAPAGPRFTDRRAAGKLRLVESPDTPPAPAASPLVTDAGAPPQPSTLVEPPPPPPLALLGPDGQPIPREQPAPTAAPGERLRRRGGKAAKATEPTPAVSAAAPPAPRDATTPVARVDHAVENRVARAPSADVAKLIEERDAARRAAETDPLTGLGNRAALDRALPAAEADAGTAVVTWDGNNFGKINKLVSQEAGDAALKDMAAAIRKAAEEHGVGERVFRRGGDEFVVLAPTAKADAIRARAEELFGERTVGEGKQAVTVSLSGTHGETFAAADGALQAAKHARKAAQAAEVAQATQREWLNFAKFGEAESPLGKALDARIRERVEALRESGQADKGYQSFDTQRALADEYARKLATNPLDIDWGKVKNLSGAEVVGLHQIVNENTAIMESAARAINSGALEGDALTAAHRAMEAAQHATDEALSRIVREKAQTARDLGFFREVAKRTLDPDVWLVQAKKLVGDAPLPDGVALEIRKLAADAKRICGGAA